jgi:hypothetical protein
MVINRFTFGCDFHRCVVYFELFPETPKISTETLKVAEILEKSLEIR